MNLTSETPSAYLEDVLKLQLRKPKNWNWQLTTSRSSPHITIPVIQLYDAKGRLLLEAKDDSGQGRTWHSSDIIRPEETTTSNVAEGYKETPLRHLQRCRSDALERHTTKNNASNKLDPIKFADKLKSSNNVLNKSCTAVSVDKNDSRKMRDEYTQTAKPEQTAIKTDEQLQKCGPNILRKSRSDMINCKGKMQCRLLHRDKELYLKNFSELANH